MDYSKKSITNLAILSLLLTIVVLLCSWEPRTYKPLFFSRTDSSNLLNSSKDELQIALEKASMTDKTLIIAVINEAYVERRENEYLTMLNLFLEGFWVGEETRPLVDHLLVVAVDKTAHDRCKFRRLNCYRLAAKDGGGGDDLAGEKLYMSGEFIEMMWKRTGFLLEVLQRGYNFVFTDTDILWLRNPLTRLNKNKTLDMEISTDSFNGNSSSETNPINTGFYFVRSNNRTISLFETWYNARKKSAGMKEQDVLKNLIRNNALQELGINARFLETLYFSGFCRDSDDVGLVVTVHANCCRSIRAKVRDLKVVLEDWKGFRNGEIRGSRNSSRNSFQWSQHRSCMYSWG